jgi:hypothetical protein
LKARLDGQEGIAVDALSPHGSVEADPGSRHDRPVPTPISCATRYI